MGNAEPCATIINGAIETLSSIIPTVVGSAGEAEYAALYLNGQNAASSRTTLRDMGYPQQETDLILP